jgi:hypothetical protein
VTRDKEDRSKIFDVDSISIAINDGVGADPPITFALRNPKL